jgi:hypothetical protein
VKVRETGSPLIDVRNYPRILPQVEPMVVKTVLRVFVVQIEIGLLFRGDDAIPHNNLIFHLFGVTKKAKNDTNVQVVLVLSRDVHEELFGVPSPNGSEVLKVVRLESRI